VLLKKPASGRLGCGFVVARFGTAV